MAILRPRFVLAIAICITAATACGPTSNGHTIDATPGDGGLGVDASPLPHTLSQITVTPTNQIVELDLNATGSQVYTATGYYMDGTSEDLTGQVTWAVANPKVGAMTGALLQIPSFSAATAEVSKITASFGGLDGNGQITVVAYRKSGPQQDFFFILPYNDPAGVKKKPLDFSTTIPSLDVFFLMDTTGSMSGEIANLQSALTGTVVPGIKAAVADSQFGVGALEDFPIPPFGSLNPNADCGSGDGTPDQPLKLEQAITSNVTAVSAGVSALSKNGKPIGCGNDWPEGSLEAIYQISTGQGLSSPAPTNVPANHTGVGGVGFRAGTMPVIVTISDADSHGKGETGSCSTTGEIEAYSGSVLAVAHSRADTKAALAGICARSVGVAAIQTTLDASCSPLAYMEDLARATGARVPPQAWDVGTRPAGCAAGQCCTDLNGAGRATDADGLCPVVFKLVPAGTGLGTQIVTGIRMLARFATFDVPTDKSGGTADILGNPLPTPHTTADFIKAVAPTSFTLPPPPPNLPNPTFDATTFHNVTPGTKVSFDVNAYNDFVPQKATAQIFRATIRVLAGGCTPLDARDVMILVPPTDIPVN